MKVDAVWVRTILVLLTLYETPVYGSICGYAEKYEAYIECIDRLKEQCYMACEQNHVSCTSCSMNVIQGLHCPANTFLLGAYCVPSITTCPLDTTFVGGLCQGYDKIQCPDAYSYINGVCLNDNATEQCTVDVRNCSIPNTNCNQISGNCQIKVYCPGNQILFNGGCVDHNLATCPLGYQIVDGTCKCNLAKICHFIKCPNGSSMVNGGCVSDKMCRRNTFEINGICAYCPLSSYHVNGRCVECPNGSILHNGKCVANQKCSTKEVLIDGKCTPLFCYGQSCCKNIECNFCFKYCQDHNSLTAQLSQCGERCINNLPPIIMVSSQNLLNETTTTEESASVSLVTPVATKDPQPEEPLLNSTTEHSTFIPATTEHLVTSPATEKLDTTTSSTEKFPSVPPSSEESVNMPPVTEQSTSVSPVTQTPIFIPTTTEIPIFTPSTTRVPVTLTSSTIVPNILPPVTQVPIIEPPVSLCPIFLPTVVEQPIITWPFYARPPMCTHPLTESPISLPIIVPPNVNRPMVSQPIMQQPLVIEQKKTLITNSKPHSGVPTKINIVNVVNSTNVRNILTNVNHMNINNINLKSGSISGSNINGTSKNVSSDGDCCVIIEPRECKKVNDKLKCFHKKIHACGSACSDFDCKNKNCTQPVLNHAPLILPQAVPRYNSAVFQIPYPTPIPQQTQRVIQTVQIPQIRHCMIQHQNRAYWICPPHQMATVTQRNSFCYGPNQWPFIQCLPNLRFDCAGCNIRQCSPVCYQ